MASDFISIRPNLDLLLVADVVVLRLGGGVLSLPVCSGDGEG